MTVRAEGIGVARHAAGLIPHPCTESSAWVLLVEGPPDMISARSQELPAIAVPADDAWEPEWAQLLVAGYVSMVLDCDQAARQVARRTARVPAPEAHSCSRAAPQWVR